MPPGNRGIGQAKGFEDVNRGHTLDHFLDNSLLFGIVIDMKTNDPSKREDGFIMFVLLLFSDELC